MTIQTKDSDGTVVIYGNPACPPAPKDGYTIRTVDAIPARATGDKTSVLRWVDPTGLAWVAPDPTLASLAATLNASLTALFRTAPIQAQVVFSNITSPIADLITAGQLAQAIAALQGMLTDQLVPPGYSAFIDPAVALITAQEAAFAAVMPAAAPAAPVS